VDVVGLEAAQWLPTETSEQLATALYVADTLAQFGKQLGVKGSGVSAQELQEAVEMVAGAGAAALQGGEGGQEGRGAVWIEKESTELVAAQQFLAGLYQQLLQVSLGPDTCSVYDVVSALDEGGDSACMGVRNAGTAAIAGRHLQAL
jgi:hypothetical protein